MLIKGVTPGGDAIPLTPQEALSAAIALGLSSKNNDEFVFWLGDKNVRAEQMIVTPKNDKDYDAFVEGACTVGKTRIIDDKFYTARPHRFKIHYMSAKDEIGAPHVKVESFEMSALETDPSKMVGEVDRTNVSIAAVDGEITPQTAPPQVQGGGRVNTGRRNR